MGERERYGEIEGERQRGREGERTRIERWSEETSERVKEREVVIAYYDVVV